MSLYPKAAYKLQATALQMLGSRSPSDASVPESVVNAQRVLAKAVIDFTTALSDARKSPSRLRLERVHALTQEALSCATQQRSFRAVLPAIRQKIRELTNAANKRFEEKKHELLVAAAATILAIQSAVKEALALPPGSKLRLDGPNVLAINAAAYLDDALSGSPRAHHGRTANVTTHSVQEAFGPSPGFDSLIELARTTREEHRKRLRKDNTRLFFMFAVGSGLLLGLAAESAEVGVISALLVLLGCFLVKHVRDTSAEDAFKDAAAALAKDADSICRRLRRGLVAVVVELESRRDHEVLTARSLNAKEESIQADYRKMANRLMAGAQSLEELGYVWWHKITLAQTVDRANRRGPRFIRFGRTNGVETRHL